MVKTDLMLLKDVLPVVELCELILEYDAEKLRDCTICHKERCYLIRNEYGFLRSRLEFSYQDEDRGRICQFCFEKDIGSDNLCTCLYGCCTQLSYCFFCKKLMNRHTRASVGYYACPFDMCKDCQERFVSSRQVKKINKR
jgi:hypothetical protein